MEKTRLEILLDAVNEIAWVLDVEDEDVLLSLVYLQNPLDGDLVEQALNNL